jgi:hypothetical protein
LRQRWISSQSDVSFAACTRGRSLVLNLALSDSQCPQKVQRIPACDGPPLPAKIPASSDCRFPSKDARQQVFLLPIRTFSIPTLLDSIGSSTYNSNNTKKGNEKLIFIAAWP